MEDKVEGEIWPTQKFWRSTPYARPLAGFIGLLCGGEGEAREGRGTEKEKRVETRKSGKKVGTELPIG